MGFFQAGSFRNLGNRRMILPMIGLYAVILVLSIGPAQGIETSVDASSVPAHKTTAHDQYLSSHDAFAALERDPDILFIDVRDPIEISMTGRPAPIDAIVPVRIQTDMRDPELNEYALVDNPAFLESMTLVLSMNGKTKSDLIIVTCGSGWRSAAAARILIDNGYTNVWHITDGYPGDEKPGLNVENAWKLAGLPWSYEVTLGSEWIRI